MDREVTNYRRWIIDCLSQCGDHARAAEATKNLCSFRSDPRILGPIQENFHEYVLVLVITRKPQAMDCVHTNDMVAMMKKTTHNFECFAASASREKHRSKAPNVR